ncbi:MAG: hypothetical protein ACLQF4_04530 [Xanthobacteraceae bacterium]
MKRWLLAGALAFAAAGQGLASDLPPPALPAPPRAPAAYVPPVSPVYNWGGVYFGFNLGYGFGTSNWSDPLDPGGTTGNFNLRGFLAGATIRANFQADWRKPSFRHRARCVVGVFFHPTSDKVVLSCDFKVLNVGFKPDIKPTFRHSSLYSTVWSQ